MLDQIAADVVGATRRFSRDWSAGIILRSSATNESLTDRGSYESVPLPADYNERAVSLALEAIFSDFADGRNSGEIAIVVQPLVPGPNRFLGHISNERRISKTVNQWMYEIQGGQADRFNSQRASPSNPALSLTAPTQRSLVPVFRSVGRWATNLGRGATHIEWAWSGGRLWLLQLDFEDDSSDDGVDPKKLLRPADTVRVLAADIEPLRRVLLTGPPTGWRKIDKVGDLAAVRTANYPQLYFVVGTDVSGADPSELQNSIQRISNGRVVCRTDCKAKSIEGLNLPRTNSVKPSQAVSFMQQTANKLVSQGADRGDICFILHRFIPATASAWALADPSKQIVRVDALWGIPDGLQFLPHDSFEYDVKRRSISSEITRFKPSFIQETEDGTWRELRVARRLARSTSLSSVDVREVAAQTYEIAKRLNERIQVMWFCDIPAELGIGRNLPWFAMSPPDFELSRSKPASPALQRVEVRTATDLVKARELQPGRFVLRVHPDVELIRADASFLKELASIAVDMRAAVELQGSILGHAYYMLEKAGVTTIALGERSYSRTRGRQVFTKLVRDHIPEEIEKQGEQTTLAQIQKQDSRAALVVKLYEEAHELLSAKSPEDVEGELADLLEVVRGLAASTGISWADVQVRADAKRKRRGGFESGTVLLETAWPKGSDSSKEQSKTVPLSALASKSEGASMALNYASLLASGADRTLRLPDGTRIQISLSGSGINILVLDKSGNKAEQIGLPGMEPDGNQS